MYVVYVMYVCLYACYVCIVCMCNDMVCSGKYECMFAMYVYMYMCVRINDMHAHKPSMSKVYGAKP